MLLHNQLGERELHSVLHDILKDVANVQEPYDGDEDFADLVRKGYFQEIISTNIDDLVEQALQNVGLFETQDFEVFIAGKQSPLQQRKLPYRITKVFGDWLSRSYTIYDRQAYIANDQALNRYLRTLLHGEVLAVGIDPLWDGALLPLLLESATTVWFVSEDETSIDHPLIASTLHQKLEKAATIVGENYRHEDFWHTLYHLLHRKQDETTEYQIPAISNKSFQQQKKEVIQVFYIYCDKDLSMMKKIWDSLQVLRSDKLIEEWHRGMLQPGDKMQIMQERYLNRAQLIFVGFSSDFINSEYYKQAEQALNLISEEKVRPIPLKLGPIGNWQRIPYREFKSLPHGSKALREMSTKELQKALKEMAEAIHDLVISLLERQT